MNRPQIISFSWEQFISMTLVMAVIFLLIYIFKGVVPRLIFKSTIVMLVLIVCNAFFIGFSKQYVEFAPKLVLFIIDFIINFIFIYFLLLKWFFSLIVFLISPKKLKKSDFPEIGIKGLKIAKILGVNFDKIKGLKYFKITVPRNHDPVKIIFTITEDEVLSHHHWGSLIELNGWSLFKLIRDGRKKISA